MTDLKHLYIEELVSVYPQAVGYLARRGIACLSCGEPVWGTLEEVLHKKGFNDSEIDAFVNKLNEYLEMTK
ncbi:MAG: DUF1858 domain-containing protein [candidate division KSB1 bacterium]|nr:DUF1858 domain-containing protein [candidate division KSB1 bacterium]